MYYTSNNMPENNDLKNWLKKNGHKLKIAYSYAVMTKLDIRSKVDVLKILQSIDPENANTEQVEIYSKILLLFKGRFRNSIEKRL